MFSDSFDKFSQVVTILNSLLRVGIDVGSTTIKVVVLNKERELIYKKYARHFSEINAVLKENLAALENVVKE